MNEFLAGSGFPKNRFAFHSDNFFSGPAGRGVYGEYQAAEMEDDP
jgi:hypothetical protein